MKLLAAGCGNVPPSRHVAHHQSCVATRAAHQSGCEPNLKRQADKVQTRNLFDNPMRSNRQAFTIEQKLR